MVFSCVDLFENAAHSGFVGANDNEEVFAEESELGVGVDNLNMRAEVKE